MESVKLVILTTFPSLDPIKIERLHRVVIDKEIKSAMFYIGPCKGPRPDGFQTQKIRMLIIRIVKETFMKDGVPYDLNKTLITLIPKTDSLLILISLFP